MRSPTNESNSSKSRDVYTRAVTVQFFPDRVEHLVYCRCFREVRGDTPTRFTQFSLHEIADVALPGTRSAHYQNDEVTFLAAFDVSLNAIARRAQVY